MRLILASGSATRAALLASAGVKFTTQPSRIDERVVEAPLLAAAVPPGDIAAALAEEKALDVSRREQGALVIGADQTLDLAGELVTKPRDNAAAREQVARLAGHTHRLHSAVAIADDGTVVWRNVQSATLAMRTLSAADIDSYIAAAGDAVTASVGGYQVESLGIRLFDSIEGDHSTILGLPLLPLLKYLRERAVLPW